MSRWEALATRSFRLIFEKWVGFVVLEWDERFRVWRYASSAFVSLADALLEAFYVVIERNVDSCVSIVLGDVEIELFYVKYIEELEEIILFDACTNALLRFRP